MRRLTVNALGLPSPDTDDGAVTIPDILREECIHPYLGYVYTESRFSEPGYPFLMDTGDELRKQGVAFQDLTGIFRDVEEPLNTGDCCHFNERGNEILAAAVARAIRQG